MMRTGTLEPTKDVGALQGTKFYTCNMWQFDLSAPHTQTQPRRILEPIVAFTSAPPVPGRR